MATTNDQLIGRVAEILNARELVVTLGRQQGIRRGMKFAVLTDPLEIRDPASGEVLDVLEREKIRVEAVDVRGRISVCRTYRQAPPTPSLVGVADDVMSVGGRESFAVSEDSLPQTDSYAKEYVKVGDRVVGLREGDS